MFIDYPDVREVITDTLESIEHSSQAGRSIAMHVVAESGAGKTTLIDELERFVTQAYVRDDPEKTIKPALRLEAPSPCTPAELCYSILEALGDPYARSRARLDQTRSLQKLTADMLTQCEVRVILFDNFQDIPSARRARGIEQLGIRLRDLIDLTRCTWVFFGTAKSRDVISAESQLLKRVPYVKEIRYFTLGDGGTKRFARLLQRFDEWLPLAESSVSVLKDLSGLIFIATEGILDRLTKMLDRAWYCAVTAGREYLTKVDFRDAFRKTFGADHANPFEESFVPRRLDKPYEPYEKFGVRVGRSVRAVVSQKGP